MLSIIKLRLLRLREDVMVFALMTAMALGFTAIFGASINSYVPTVLVVDEDNSYYSEYLINELTKNKGFRFENTDLTTASEKIEEGNAVVALLIKQGFNENIEKGNDVSLGMLKVKDDTVILTIQELVSSITLKMAGGIRIADVTASFIQSVKPEVNPQEIKTSAYNNVMDSWKYKNPLTVTTTIAESGIDSGYDSLMHSMIGFTLFFSMYTMVFSIGTILSDKQHKTWERMLVSPVSKSSILGGTMTVSYLSGAVQMGVLILCGKYLLKIDWGNSMSGVLLVSAAFIFAVTSLGLMLSSFIKTQGQLGTIAPIVLTSTSMIGGTMWPLEIVNNKALLFLAELTPQKWAMQGIESIASMGMGFEAAILPTIVLMVMGIIYFSVGVRALNKETL
ncbi:MAG: ABC transporter permease [Sedimentibacter sp.]